MSLVSTLTQEARLLALTMRARTSRPARQALEAEARKMLTVSGEVKHFKLRVDSWHSFRAAGTSPNGAKVEYFAKWDAFRKSISGFHVRQPVGSDGWFADLSRRFLGR